jgi:DNA sulfur modification protein DndB
LRDKCLHGHAVALEAIGRVGGALFRERPETWDTDLTGFAALDWLRKNSVWAGRALLNGRVSTTASSVRPGALVTLLTGTLGDT